jgi:hypothetical protein
MLSVPVLTATFFDLPALGAVNQPFFLPDNRKFNKTGGGVIIGYQRGARLWEGSVNFIPMDQRDAKSIDAIMSFIQETGVYFRIYDRTTQFPRNDPTGTVLTTTPTLTSVNANNHDITVSTLPVGYVLSPGDTLNFVYSSTRLALHRIVVGATASGGGVATVTVTPPIRPGFTLSSTVNFKSAAMNAVVVPGSYRSPDFGPGKVSSGGSFDFIQTLRT